MASFIELCTELGLSDRESRLFQTLLTHGPQTVVELSRHTQIPRTQIYRLMERLESLQIITRLVESHRIKYAAENQSRLESLVNQKIHRLADLHRAFPDIISSLNPAQTDSDTTVKFYKGPEGVTQMIWHEASAKELIVGYSYRDIASVTGSAFADDFYLEIIRQRIHIRDIFSDSYIDSVGGWDNAVKPSFPHPDWAKLVTSRYLPDQKLPINHQLDIYNATVALYNWFQGEVFGVEIINPKVAAFQTQIFELVWSLSQPIKNNKI